jgi:opacity protein-like surface antigen
MKFAKSFALIATVVLSSASVAVASDVNVNTNNNREKLTNEAQGMCWPGRFNCGSL